MNEELTIKWENITEKLNKLTSEIDNFNYATQSSDELDKLHKKLKDLTEEYEELSVELSIEILFARVEDQLVEEGYLKLVD